MTLVKTSACILFPNIKIHTHDTQKNQSKLHAILHVTNGLHRDLPVDHADNNATRDHVEIEANKFATYFLMPKKMARERFEILFLSKCFILNDESRFALSPALTYEVENKCSSIRDLLLLLASAEFYNGRNFVYMAKYFGVSVEAMAIRIKELKLCKF